MKMTRFVKFLQSRRLAPVSTCWAGLCVALVFLMPAGGHAACKLNAIELPVTMVGQRAIATLEINGVQVPMVVDSGAVFSMLTEAAATQLGLPLTKMPARMQVHGLTGAIDTQMTTVKRLGLLKGDIPNVEFIVGSNEMGSGAMGLLGRNLLAFTDTEYDLANGVIRFMFPEGDCSGQNMAYWAGQSPVSELALHRDVTTKLPDIAGAGRLNDKNVRVVFDTGAVSAVSLKAARRAGVNDADMKPAGRVVGAGRGEAKAWTAPIRKFELDGESVQNNQLLIADFDFRGIDVLLGVDYFLSHRIYVAKEQRRMYFTYNGGPVFALNTHAVDAAASGASTPGAEEPTSAASYARRGAASAARRDYASALADLNRACDMAPDVADHFMRRAVVHEALKQSSEALRDDDTALSLDPALTEARLHRAWLRSRAKDRDGALDDLAALDQQLAPQSQARLQLARRYEELGLLDRALSQWTQWIPSHRTDVLLPNILNSRCWARVLLNAELEKAAEDCDAAVDLKPKTAEFFDSRAWLNLRRGQLREAAADYDRALAIRPDMAWTIYGRGIARVRLGDADRGRADIEAARRLLPTVDAETARHGLSAEKLLPPPLS